MMRWLWKHEWAFMTERMIALKPKEALKLLVLYLFY